MSVKRKSGAPRRGRPPGQHDTDHTKLRILAAADAEFAAHGLEGARVNEIAQRAGINKRMLYSYFGNKEALWLRVLERAYAARRGAERDIDIRRMAPDAALETLIRFNFRYCRDHPEFIALLDNENLHRAEYLRQSDEVRDLHTPLLGTLGELLERGVAEGLFRAGVAPMQLYITLASLSYFYFSHQWTLSTIFAVELDDEALIQAREDHIVEVILSYLRAPQQHL